MSDLLGVKHKHIIEFSIDTLGIDDYVHVGAGKWIPTEQLADDESGDVIFDRSELLDCLVFAFIEKGIEKTQALLK